MELAGESLLFLRFAQCLLLFVLLLSTAGDMGAQLP